MIGTAEKFYNDLIENASNYNAQLSKERRMRLPFLDSQTGVAQYHSNLQQTVKNRRPGQFPGQLYHYPQRRWVTKKRPFPIQESPPRPAPPSVPQTPTGPPMPATSSGGGGNRLASILAGGSAQEMHSITAVENPAAAMMGNHDDGETSARNTPVKQSSNHSMAEEYHYQDWDELDDPPDAGEIAPDTDSSDFEDYGSKRKRKRGGKKTGGRGGNRGGGRKKASASADKSYLGDDDEKPYACEHCGARYKTRPGLSYHVNHHHNKDDDDDADVADASMAASRHASPKPSAAASSSRSATPVNSGGGGAYFNMGAGPIPSSAQSSATPSQTNSQSEPGSSSVSAARKKENSKYCDFCLGNELENKKTGGKEEMVSCADCGRSGHPSCLQFTNNMIISVKKYPWQCIECKSCGLCGTSDNDDQLLFCDDCDRGYHMYCLTPPLSSPPEGSWSCHLCIQEFYGGRKPDTMQ